MRGIKAASTEADRSSGRSLLPWLLDRRVGLPDALPFAMVAAAAAEIGTNTTRGGGALLVRSWFVVGFRFARTRYDTSRRPAVGMNSRWNGPWRGRMIGMT